MTDVRVLQLNAWMSGTQVPNGVSRLVDVIRQSNAGIVMLCEALPAAVEQIRAGLATSSGVTWYAVSDPERNAVISRWPLARTGSSLWHVAATVTHPNRKIAVYSVHLEWEYYAAYLARGYGASAGSTSVASYGWGAIPTGPVLDDRLIAAVNMASGRPQAVAQIVSAMKADAKAGLVVVAGGDFNEPSCLDWTVETMNVLDHHGSTHAWETSQVLSAAGFVDVFRQAHPDPVISPGLTWPASVPDAAVSALTWTPQADARDRLDFVFHDPATTVVATASIYGPPQSIAYLARVTDVDAADMVVPTAQWPSDHRGNLTDLTLT